MKMIVRLEAATICTICEKKENRRIIFRYCCYATLFDLLPDRLLILGLKGMKFGHTLDLTCAEYRANCRLSSPPLTLSSTVTKCSGWVTPSLPFSLCSSDWNPAETVF